MGKEAVAAGGVLDRILSVLRGPTQAEWVQTQPEHSGGMEESGDELRFPAKAIPELAFSDHFLVTISRPWKSTVGNHAESGAGRQPT